MYHVLDLACTITTESTPPTASTSNRLLPDKRMAAAMTIPVKAELRAVTREEPEALL